MYNNDFIIKANLLIPLNASVLSSRLTRSGFFYWLGETKSQGTAATYGLLYKPQMIDEDDFWSNWWNKNWQGKPKYSEKTCPSATLSTTYPIWPNRARNPDRLGGKPAANRLSYGAAVRKVVDTNSFFFYKSVVIAVTNYWVSVGSRRRFSNSFCSGELIMTPSRIQIVVEHFESYEMCLYGTIYSKRKQRSLSWDRALTRYSNVYIEKLVLAKVFKKFPILRNINFY
jgi:hypothetical protein